MKKLINVDPNQKLGYFRKPWWHEKATKLLQVFKLVIMKNFDKICAQIVQIF